MSLFKSTAIVSFFTLLSRISGFVRDMLFARFFGTSVWTDAFFVVFKIPNFLRRIFAEGSFSLAFVPVLNDIKATGSREDLKDFIDHVAGSLTAVLLIVFALMQLFAPWILSIFDWPDENPSVFPSSVEMFRYTLFYLPTISLVAFAGGILNSFHRFAIPAATPILLNLSLIVMAVYFRNSFDLSVMALAVGVMIAGFAQLLFQIPALIRLGVFPRFRVNFKDSKVRKVMKLMGPTLFGSSIAQINLFIDTLIATFLPLAGSVSFLYFSDRLLEFPLGVFAIAISTVILPSLSRQFASEDKGSFEKTMRWALNLGFWIGIPSALGLLILSNEVVYTLFQYDKFTPSDSHFVSLSLMAYMLALPAFVLNKILMPAFFARKDTKTPVKIGVICMLFNMVFNVAFVASLWVFEIEALHVGLALASAGSGWLQTVLLFKTLRGRNILSPAVIDGKVILKILFSAIFMTFAVFYFKQWMPVLEMAFWYQRLIALSGLILTGLMSYLLCLYVLKLSPKSIFSK